MQLAKAGVKWRNQWLAAMAMWRRGQLAWRNRNGIIAWRRITANLGGK